MKQKFNRVPILHNFGWRSSDNRVPGEATSIVEEKYALVVSGKNRNKVEIASVWLDTPENRDIQRKIQSHRTEIDRLHDDIRTLENSTARLTAEMMQDD